MTRPNPSLRAALSALAFALAANAATAQVEPREPRTFVPPPPSANSTGGAPVDPASVKEMRAAPSLRGRKLVTRDALHPEQIELVGLEQSGEAYRSDLDLKRSQLAAHPNRSEENLHQRQLAIFTGGPVTTRLPEVAPKRSYRASFAQGANDLAAETRPWWAISAVGSVVFSILLVRRKLTRRT
jgi:hypothetical protein